MKGADAEDLALAYLQKQGLKLVLRNYRARGGEIDLVMRDAKALIVVEVRKRSSTRYGTAAESVDARKRARIVLAARWLLAQRADLAKLAMRFDVVTLDADDKIEWIRAAFDAEG
ncbi:MAG: YraN family protein [Hydrocarboniphaga sp.]|uniref:YraN family protein n=1 Tax=Hydrocarboniphaga sp. TaxID=2033016 RepID=UPI0026085D40|nr:YraN family protein [Hydrocarboniphaga sp.]MDB5969578.1 YraN family protein [Hydrocarboniphaga sp.]